MEKYYILVLSPMNRKNQEKTFYLVPTLMGLLVPYAFFLPFVAENGLDISLMVEQAFTTRSSAFFAVNVIISAVAVIVFFL